MRIARTSRFIVCCVCFTLLQAGASVADEVDREGYKVVRYLDKTLSRKGKRVFSKAFVEYGYFSAFAVSATLGEATYGYTVGTSDRDFAQKQALANCNGYLKTNGEKGPCKLYAEVIPSGKQHVHIVNGDTLSQWSAQGYARYLTDQKNPFKAFAYTKNGGWAYGKSAASAEDAQRKALKKCRGYTKKTSSLPKDITNCRLAP